MSSDAEIARLRSELDQTRATLRNTMGIGAGVALSLSAGIAWMHMSPPPAAESDGILLRDGQGMVRASLSIEGPDDTVLRLSDPKGNSRIALRVGESHSTIELTEANQRTMVRLATVGGLSTLQLSDALGVRSALLRASEADIALELVDNHRMMSEMFTMPPINPDEPIEVKPDPEPDFIVVPVAPKSP